MVAHLSGVNWANLDLPEFLKLEHFETRYSEEGGDLAYIGSCCAVEFWQFKCKNIMFQTVLYSTLSFFFSFRNRIINCSC